MISQTLTAFLTCKYSVQRRAYYADASEMAGSSRKHQHSNGIKRIREQTSPCMPSMQYEAIPGT